LDTLLAGRAAVPASLDWFEQSLGALLGLLIPMLVALAPIWLAGLLQATRVLLGGALSLLLSILAGLLYLVAVFAGQIRRLMPVAFDLVTFPSRVVRERFE
jgi:amino acid permease